MKVLRQLLVLIAAAFAAEAVTAQSYPSKPVRLVVGFPAGGPADIFGRTFAQALSSGLSQPVIVENKSGVGGVLGIDMVAKASPDGYMLGFNNQGSVAMAPYALTKMPFNPNKDLALITTVVKVPEVVVVNPSLPVNSLAELIAYAKANPGRSTSAPRERAASRTSPASCSRPRRASTCSMFPTRAQRPR